MRTPQWPTRHSTSSAFAAACAKALTTGWSTNALPGLAPAGTRIKEAPPFSGFLLHNADLEGSGGIPPAGEQEKLADEIRAADGVIYILGIDLQFPAA